MSKKVFKPIKLEVNQIAYNNAIRDAESKLNNFKAALNFAFNNHVKESDLNDKAFNESFTQEFKRCFLKANSKKVNLSISYEKLLDLLSVNLKTLKELEYLHHENPSTLISVDNETIAAKVDIEDYTTYTKNESENQRVYAAENLIDALDKVAKFSKVYPVTITQGISNFLLFDMSKNEYKINRTLIPKI